MKALLYLRSQGLDGWTGQSPPTLKHQKGKPVQTLYDDNGKVLLVFSFYILKFSYVILYVLNFFELHVAYRMYEGRQKKPSVKTLGSSFLPNRGEALRVEWWNSTPRFASTPE